MDPSLARRLWQRLEPLHALVYFAPEAREAMKDLGLKGYWMGYFAGRAAPMGAAPPELVEATFFGFAPVMVRRALPDAWALAPPEAVWAARCEALGVVLDRVLGAMAGSAELLALASELLDAAAGTPRSGRPLFAATGAMQVPDSMPLQLWFAATLVREHRGDGHIAVLVGEDLDGIESHVSATLAGARREALQPNRGWTDEEWDAAVAALRSRGWLDREGQPTDAGREARARIEARTDDLSAALLGRLADPEAALGKLVAVDEAVRNAGLVPFPNPMGVPKV